MKIHIVNISIKLAKYLLLALSLVYLSTVSAEIQVKVFLDKSSAGWAYKNSDYAYVVNQGECKIQWNAVENKQGERSLSVRRDCDKSFAEQLYMHRAILQQIQQRWPLKSFRTIYWGMFCQQHDMDWCVPVAKASLRSEDYIDYWQNYPNSRLKSPNQLFVDLANQTRAYAPLAELFGEFELKIKLDSVEKVFSNRLSKSPFHHAFKEEVPAGNPRVMYNVGMAYFSIDTISD